jgi:hypothetical protein
LARQLLRRDQRKFTVVRQRIAQRFGRFTRIQRTVGTVVHAVDQQHAARIDACACSILPTIGCIAPFQS